MLFILFDSNIMFAIRSLLGCFLDLVWDLSGFYDTRFYKIPGIFRFKLR